LAEVITFQNYRPPARYDDNPWTTVRIQEASASDGTYTMIEAITLTPLDTDPSNPMLRSFTTELGTAPEYWYSLTFADATGDTSLPTTPVQNIIGAAITAVVAFGTVAELARRLKLSSPTTAQTEAMQLCLDSAAQEINWELSGTPSWTPPPSTPPYPPLVVEVNYERAVEHWQQGLSAFGAIPVGPDAVPVFAARNSWYRHHVKLLPLKGSFGIA
jgi:hypothetical protein